MSFPAGDRAEARLERTVLTGAARFSRAGLAGHGAHGLHVARAARAVGTPGPPQAREEDAGPPPGRGTRAVPVRRPPQPRAPDPGGLRSRPGATGLPTSAPGAGGRGEAAQDPDKLSLLSNPGAERRWAAIQNFFGGIILNYLSPFPSGEAQRTGRDRNFAGGDAGLPQSLPPQGPAAALPRSGEPADASEGIETQGPPSCGRPMGPSGVPGNPCYLGPGAPVAGRE